MKTEFSNVCRLIVSAFKFPNFCCKYKKELLINGAFLCKTGIFGRMKKLTQKPRSAS